MKQLALFLLLLTPFWDCYGQKNEPKETSVTTFRKIQIGINFSPDICFRTLKNDDGSSSSNLVITQRNALEIAKIGYTTGINACFNIKTFLAVEAGIQYSNKGYRTKKYDLVFAQPGQSFPQQTKNIFSVHYIDVPLKVKYILGKKRLRFLGGIGLVTNIFLKEMVTKYYYYSDHTDKKRTATGFNYNTINLSSVVSIGIDYKINNRMNLRLEPTFKYSLLKMTPTPVVPYLYNAGLNVSYYFGL